MRVKLALLKLCVCAAISTTIAPCKANSQELAVQPKGIYSSDFNINGIPRNITFYIPQHYGKYDNYPVVFFLHAEGGSGNSLLKKYGDEIQHLADSSNSIVVCPDAFKGHWNTGLGEHASTDSINDVGFIAIMLDYFVQRYHGDLLRIYAAGFYNGGDMAWRLGCGLPNKIAAVAPFITTEQTDTKTCTPHLYINAGKFMPAVGAKFNNGALSAAWQFLMGSKKTL